MSETVDKPVNRYGFPPKSTVLKILEDGHYVLFRDFHAMQQRAFLAEALVKRLEAEKTQQADQHQTSLERVQAQLEEVRADKKTRSESAGEHQRRLNSVPGWAEQALKAIREGDLQEAVEVIQTISLAARAFIRRMPANQDDSHV